MTTDDSKPSLELSGRRATIAVLSLAFGGLVATLMQSLIVPLLPQLPELLDAPASQTSWLVTATLLSGAVSNVLGGRLADMYGKRKVLIVCLSLLILGSLLGALVNTVGLLIVARSLQGSAMAMVPVGTSALRDLVSGKLLIKSIAVISAMVGVGGTLGFTISAVMAEFLDWHWLFVGSAVLGGISLLGILFFLPDIPGHSGGKLDVPGVLGLVVGIVGILLAITEGGQWGWFSPLTIGCLLGSVALLVLWGWHQTHTEDPLIDLRTVASRPVLFTNLSMLLVGFSMYGSILTTPQLIQLPEATGYGFGQSVLVAGLCVAPGAFFALLAPNLAARLTQMRGPRTTLAIGAAIIVAGFVLLLIDHSELWQIVVSSALTSVGVGFCFGAAPTLIMEHVPRAKTGEANGINNLARSLGTSTSSAVIAAIFAGMVIQDGFGAGTLPSESAFLFVFASAAVAGLLVIGATAAIGNDGPRASKV